MNMYANSVDAKDDWRFFQNIYTFTYYFGLAPFKSASIRKSTRYLRKLYIIFVEIVYIYGNYLQVTFKLTYQHEFKQFATFIDVAQTIFETINISVILICQNFTYTQNWQQFFNLMNEIELYFDDKLHLTKNLKRFYIELCVTLTILFIFVIEDGSLVDLYEEKCFLSFHFTILCQTVNLFLIITILRIIRRRYNCLNNFIKQCVQEKVDEDVKINKIKDAIKLYGKLFELINEFNKIFGTFLLTYICYFTLLSIYWTSLFLQFDDINNLFLFTTLLPMYIIHMMMTFGIVLISARLQETGRHFSTNCYILLNDLKNWENQLQIELFIAAKQSLMITPRITVFGFFNIDRSTISSITSVVLTHIIVISQLGGFKSNNM